jgi:hypothetical protein
MSDVASPKRKARLKQLPTDFLWPGHTADKDVALPLESAKGAAMHAASGGAGGFGKN